MQRILITDSNILFDLYHGGILDVIKQLPYEFWIPDFAVMNEFVTPSWREIETLGVIPISLTSAQVQEVYELHMNRRQLSIIDISAFLIAKRTNVPLLTGDNHLRLYATREGVEVHGLLWLLDQAILHQCLVPQKAADVLQYLLSIGSRFPRNECEERISRWRLDH